MTGNAWLDLPMGAGLIAGAAAAAAALYGRYRELPALLTGPTICRTEASGTRCRTKCRSLTRRRSSSDNSLNPCPTRQISRFFQARVPRLNPAAPVAATICLVDWRLVMRLRQGGL